MTEVVKLSIWSIILYFATYVILHYLIIKLYNDKEIKLKENITDEKLLQDVKYFKFAKNWFPAIYVVVLVLILYFS